MADKVKKKYEIDMCNGPILKKMLVFALPLMLSSILQLLFNAADIVVVGRFAGDDSLAAVGSTSSLINLLTNLFIGLSVGSNVLVARYFGAKKDILVKDSKIEEIGTKYLVKVEQRKLNRNDNFCNNRNIVAKKNAMILVI